MFKEIKKKLGWKTLFSAGFDIILIIYFLVAFFVWIKAMTMRFSTINFPSGDLMSASAAQLEQFQQYLMGLMTAIFTGIFIIFIVFVALYTFFKLLTWAWMLKKKFNWKVWLKMSLINMLLMIIVLIPVISFMIQYKNIIVMHRDTLLAIFSGAVFVFMFFSNVMMYHMLHTKEFWRSIQYSFRKFFRIIPHYIAFFAIFIAIFWIFSLFIIPGEFLLFLIIILAYVSLSRIYLCNVLEKHLGSR